MTGASGHVRRRHGDRLVLLDLMRCGRHAAVAGLTVLITVTCVAQAHAELRPGTPLYLWEHNRPWHQARARALADPVTAVEPEITIDETDDALESEWETTVDRSRARRRAEREAFRKETRAARRAARKARRSRAVIEFYWRTW